MSALTTNATRIEKRAETPETGGPTWVALRSRDGVQVHDGFVKGGCLHLFKGYADDEDKDYLHLCGTEEIDELISTLLSMRAEVAESDGEAPA